MGKTEPGKKRRGARMGDEDMDFRDFSLETFISMGLKDDLIDACEYLQVDYRKSWNKTKLSEALAESYRKDPVKLFFTLPHEGMEFLARLMKEKCTMVIDSSKKSYKPQNPRDFMYTLEILEFFGLIFINEIPGTYEESISVTTPYEVKKIMAPFLTKERREAAKYMDLVADLIRGALYYYGAMKVSKLVEIIQEKLPDLSEDICYMVLTYRVTLRDYIHFDEIRGVEYVFRNIYDPQDEELERKEDEELLRRITVRTDIDYKPFSVEDLLLASMEGFVEDIEGYQKVADAFREHYLPTEALLEHVEGEEEDEGLIEEEFGMFMRAMVEEVRRTGDSTYALKMVGSCMNFKTKEAMEKAIPLLMNFLNSISRYELKGHSPLEIGRSFNGGGGNVVPFRREKAIGRNEPCPCGSGKKYKDCHGSRKNPLN